MLDSKTLKMMKNINDYYYQLYFNEDEDFLVQERIKEISIKFSIDSKVLINSFIDYYMYNKNDLMLQNFISKLD